MINFGIDIVEVTQVAFPATAVPSADPNTLDDYEEGTWTPEVADALSGGNIGSAGTATGLYTKIGRLVTASFKLINIDTTGMTGGNDFFIRDLPFNSVAAINHSGSVFTGNVTFTEFITLRMGGGSTVMRLAEIGSGAILVIILVSEIADDSADIEGVITYETT